MKPSSLRHGPKASLSEADARNYVTTLLYITVLRLSWQVLLQVMGQTWFEQNDASAWPQQPKSNVYAAGQFRVHDCSGQFHRLVPASPQPACSSAISPAQKGSFSDPQAGCCFMATAALLLQITAKPSCRTSRSSNGSACCPSPWRSCSFRSVQKNWSFADICKASWQRLACIRFVWIMIPSAIFGLLHYDPAVMGAAAPWIVSVHNSSLA